MVSCPARQVGKFRELWQAGGSYFLQPCHLSQWFIMTYFWWALRSKSRFIIDFQDEDSQSASSSSKMVICLEDEPSCTVCHFGIDTGTVLFSFGGRVHGVSKPLLSMRYPRRSWFLMQRNEGTQRDLQDSLFPTMPGMVTVLRAMTSVQTQVYFQDDMGLLIHVLAILDTTSSDFACMEGGCKHQFNRHSRTSWNLRDFATGLPI